MGKKLTFHGKNQIYLSVASTDRPLCEPGPSQAKNAGGFKRDSQEDVQLLQSSDRKAQHTAWRHWALLLWGDQTWGHQGPEPTEPAADEREDPSTPRLHPHVHRGIPAHSSPAHIICPREHPPLNKRRKNRKKKQLQVLIQHRLEVSLLEPLIIQIKQWCFPFL